jgi:cellulose synthase/poly-beta-1,6-N-acetylglucosamine synthase-like glycosyltransferase
MIITIITALVSLYFFLYITSFVIITWQWYRLKPLTEVPFKRALPFVSVLIPVRNEGENLKMLLPDLAAQSYKDFEVIFVNDNSEDDTLAVLLDFQKTSPFSLRILDFQPEPHEHAYKKACVTYGVKVAKGELIVSTDGDCRVQPDWIAHIATFFARTNAKFISMPVTFYGEKKILEHLQTVEFASMIGVGAAMTALNKPNTCSAANMAYPKKVFEEVKGFEGFTHIASGDDEFLLHKVAEKYPNEVFYLKKKEIIVYTQPQKTLLGFINQRKRWASKVPYYKSKIAKSVGIFFFGFQIAFLASFFLLLHTNISLSYFFILHLSKLITEFVFLAAVLIFLNKKEKITYIPLLLLVYPAYMLVVGIAGQMGKIEWKRRIVT